MTVDILINEYIFLFTFLPNMHLNPSLPALLPRSAVSVPCPVIRAGAKLFCLRISGFPEARLVLFTDCDWT
jgi:hypothetical protein